MRSYGAINWLGQTLRHNQPTNDTNVTIFQQFKEFSVNKCVWTLEAFTNHLRPADIDSVVFWPGLERFRISTIQCQQQCSTR